MISNEFGFALDESNKLNMNETTLLIFPLPKRLRQSVRRDGTQMYTSCYGHNYKIQQIQLNEQKGQREREREEGEGD